MHIYPWLHHDFDWHKVQKVWHVWQSLNVGILAFSASVVALVAATRATTAQREQNFAASKASLPDALSKLINYLVETKKILEEAYPLIKDTGTNDIILSLPELDQRVMDVFRECIRYSSPEVNDHLGNILRKLQIHTARMTSFVESLTANSNTITVKADVSYRFCDLAELHSLVDNIFPYARSSKRELKKYVGRRAIYNALGALDVIPEHYVDLTGLVNGRYPREPSPKYREYTFKLGLRNLKFTISTDNPSSNNE